MRHVRTISQRQCYICVEFLNVNVTCLNINATYKKHLSKPMLNMRNNHELYRAVYVTKNLGETWYPHPTNRNTLIEPHCNGSLIRFNYQQARENKHLLLFSNPRSQKARTHQTIQVSLNNGLTWPSKYHLLLDQRQGRGYPSMTRIDDQHIGIVYEGSQANLVFEKISLDELLNR